MWRRICQWGRPRLKRRSHLLELVDQARNLGVLVGDGGVLDLDLGPYLDQDLLELCEFLLSLLKLATLPHLLVSLSHYILDVPLRRLALAHRALTILVSPSHVPHLLLDIGVLARDTTLCLRPLPRMQDAADAFELGARLLPLEEGTLLRAEMVEFRGDFFSEERGYFVYAFFFLAHCFLGLVFAFFEHAGACGFFDHAEDFLGTHVKDLEGGEGRGFFLFWKL